MRVIHDPSDGPARVLATEVEIADGLLSQGRGLMFRRSIPDDYALVFRFGRQASRPLHMVFVPFPIDAVWLCDDVVQRVATLAPWTGHGRSIGDTVIELSVDAAAGVEPGDRVRVEPTDGDGENA